MTGETKPYKTENVNKLGHIKRLVSGFVRKCIKKTVALYRKGEESNPDVSRSTYADKRKAEKPVKTKRGTLDQSIRNNDIENTVIIAQGQQASFIGSGGVDTFASLPSSSSDREHQMELLQQGYGVDQSIRNARVKRTVILAQGQNAQVHGVNVHNLGDVAAMQEEIGMAGENAAKNCTFEDLR